MRCFARCGFFKKCMKKCKILIKIFDFPSKFAPKSKFFFTRKLLKIWNNFRFRLPKDVSVFTMSNHTSFFDGFLASHILGWRKIRTLSGAPRDFWSRFDYFSTKSIQNHVFQISSQNYFFFFDWLEIQKSRFRYTCVWTYSRPCRWCICVATAVIFYLFKMLWHFSGTLHGRCAVGRIPNQKRLDEGLIKTWILN